MLVRDDQRGEIICSNCGIVIRALLEYGPEWRSYSSLEEKNRARGGSPLSPMAADMGLRTQISRSSKDAKGKTLSSQRRYEFNRLHAVDNRTRYGEIRNLRIALKELKRVKSQLELSDELGRSAAMIYRKSLKKNLIRGRSIDGMVAASIYIACRQQNIPLTLKDVLSTCTSVTSKELGRCVRILIKELHIKPNASDFSALIHRLGEQLSMTMKTRAIACSIIDDAKSHGITVGKNPMSVAAASLYIAGVKSGERRTQQQIAKVAKTTPVTIRNRFKELLNVLQMEQVEIKRGAAAIPVYISDPRKFFEN